MNLIQPVTSRFQGFLVLALFVCCWWAVGALGLIDRLFLPSPTEVAIALWNEGTSGSLVLDCVTTGARFLAGFAIALAVAFPLGIAIGRSDRLYWLLEPLIEVLRPIPAAAIIPVAILFLGIDDAMKIAVIAFGSVWPLLLNTIHGVRAIDPLLIDTGRSLGLTARRFLVSIVLPAAAPSMATGVRIAAAVALILSITVEMIAGGSGVGYRILDFERSFRYPNMYAGIVTIGALGWSLNAILTSLDRRLLFWTARPGASRLE